MRGLANFTATPKVEALLTLKTEDWVKGGDGGEGDGVELVVVMVMVAVVVYGVHGEGS